MKKIIVLIFIMSIYSFAHAQDMKGMDMSKKEKAQKVQPTTYTCSMHPEIHADKPGKCPKCGMTLIKEKAKTGKKTVVKKHDEMQIPMKKTSEKKGSMDNMKTDANASHQNHNMSIMDMTKATLETVTKIENNTPPRTVRYDLYVRDTIVNFTGKPKRAIAVNGQIPMPTLTFTEGDTAEIYVHNELDEETSLHWHGLFLPNKEDGVPNLTQMPIKPNTTHKYTFPIIQQGTHWYHSHSGLQEQIGMYGSFIMNKKTDDLTFRKGIDDLPTVPIVLSEWTDLNPKNVHRMLHNANDYPAIKKGTTQSYTEAIKQGYLGVKLKNEWKRMNAMDVSDVFYDKILMNGKQSTDVKSIDGKPLKAGDKVRLRVSNVGLLPIFGLLMPVEK